jgi:hypothetical protein
MRGAWQRVEPVKSLKAEKRQESFEPHAVHALDMHYTHTRVLPGEAQAAAAANVVCGGRQRRAAGGGDVCRRWRRARRRRRRGGECACDHRGPHTSPLPIFEPKRGYIGIFCRLGVRSCGLWPPAQINNGTRKTAVRPCRGHMSHFFLMCLMSQKVTKKERLYLGPFRKLKF